MITYPNLYYLKYFADAVELQSISGAAQRNSVSHPAVSRAISNLERHLGVQLLHHQRKLFKVTPTGEKVATQARALLSSATTFNALSLKIAPAESAQIVLGISRSLSTVYLSPLLKTLRETFDGAQIQVKFGTTAEIAEAVASKDVDLGLTIGSQTLPTLKQYPTRSGQFILIESSKPKTARDSFKTNSFVLTEPRPETELLKHEYQRQFGVPLKLSVQVKSWDVICELVHDGLGIGLVPDIALKGWKKDSFKILRPSWFASEYEIYLHHLRQHSPRQIIQFAVDWIINTEKPPSKK